MSTLLAWFRSRRAAPQAELRTVVVRVTLPFLLVCSVGLAITVWSQVRDAHRGFERRVEVSSSLYAQALAEPLVRSDARGLEAVARTLSGDPALLRLVVRDARGEEVFRHQRPQPAPPSGLASLVTATHEDARDIVRRGESVGTQEVLFHKDGARHVWRFKPVIVMWMAIGSTLLVAAVAGGIARGFGRRYRRILARVRSTAITVDDATLALRDASASQSSAAAQSSAALAETQAVAVEVANAAAVSAERARTLDDIARQSEQEAGEAIRAVSEARNAMRAVQEQSRAIGEAITRFSRKAAAVGEIASTVSGLAERSNLLALNAALEASRAGAKGKAFSVVAREMRALAEATNRSAASVSGIVEEVQGAVGGWSGESVEGAQRVARAEQTASEALEAIQAFGQSTHQLAGLGKELTDAGRDQRTAIEQTVEALRQANGAAAEQLDGVREVDGSAERLTAISRSLVGVIDGTEKADDTSSEARTVARRRLRPLALLRRINVVTLPLALFCAGMLVVALNLRPPLETLARRYALERNEPLISAVAATLAVRETRSAAALLASAVTQEQARYLVLRDASGGTVAAVGSVPAILEESPEGVLRDGVVHLTTALPDRGAWLSAGFGTDEADDARSKSTGVTFFIAVLVFLGGALIAYTVARQYAHVFEFLLVAVERAAVRMDALIGRLASTTSQQSAAAAEASAALSETNASAAEVGRGATAAAGRALLLIGGGEGCGHDADVATAAIARAREAMATLRAHVTELSSAITGFGGRAEAIGNVATNVATLSERSELLAVNAAIEAARAGGATAGFAVVAEEMRALADGSSRAASQVKEIVVEVRRALEKALEDAREGERRVRAAESLTEAASRCVERFAEVGRAFVKLGNELGAAASQQKTAIEQMVQAIAEAAESSAAQASGTDAVQEVAHRLVELSRGLVEATTSRKEREARIDVVPTGRAEDLDHRAAA